MGLPALPVAEFFDPAFHGSGVASAVFFFFSQSEQTMFEKARELFRLIDWCCRSADAQTSSIRVHQSFLSAVF
jgi:hypothetical protein